MNKQTLRAVMVPALAFQALIIAGGYGTGRELVEFFLSMGPWGGLLGMLVSACIWSVICALSFEFARRFQAYDYRQFFQCLLGRGWIVFEIGYLLLTILILSIVASSAANILLQTLAIPYFYGVLLVLTYICCMVWRGGRAIARALSFWSIMLYIVFGVFFVLSFNQFGDKMLETLRTQSLQGAWLQQGVAYAGYNLGLIPAVLFTLHRLQTTKQAFLSGVLAGSFTILPGLAFFVIMCAFYPSIVNETIPSTYIIAQLQNPYFSFIFHIVLLGTITETGTGLIHSVNQRINSTLQVQAKNLPRFVRPIVALGFMLTTLFLSQLGLVALISKGYGTITWLFIAIFVVPLLTVGVYKLHRNPQKEPLAASQVV